MNKTVHRRMDALSRPYLTLKSPPNRLITVNASGPYLRDRYRITTAGSCHALHIGGAHLRGSTTRLPRLKMRIFVIANNADGYGSAAVVSGATLPGNRLLPGKGFRPGPAFSGGSTATRLPGNSWCNWVCSGRGCDEFVAIECTLLGRRHPSLAPFVNHRCTAVSPWSRNATMAEDAAGCNGG